MIRWCGIFCILFFVLSSCAPKPFRIAEEQHPTVLDRVMRRMRAAPGDFSRTKYLRRDPFLLRNVAGCLADPHSFVSYAHGVDALFAGRQLALDDFISACAYLIDADPSGYAPADAGGTGSEAGAAETLYASLTLAARVFQKAFSGLSDNETENAKQRIEEMLFRGDVATGRTRREKQQIKEQVFAAASLIDVEAVAGAAWIMSAAAGRIAASQPAFEARAKPLVRTTPLGAVVIGTPGDDIYVGPAPCILLDPGGNDVYMFTQQAQFSVIIDYCGDDTYRGSSGWSPASGVAGVSILVDLRGDDLYQGDRFSLGCGFMGAGVLWDGSGDDRYAGGMFCQGAAALGIGALFDGEGSDRYTASLFAQGFGYVGGAGVLADMAGDDVLVSGNVVPDAREQDGAFQTYSQGFGLGCRLFASGGTGLLLSGEGNDRYRGSYFCQGASYWQSMGMLIDRSGNDIYNARRYAQGAGVHSSAGALIDCGGDDAYRSWGVSQGCGHDYSAGLLHDVAGDDSYEAQWLSQGAGSSRGAGMLVDERGSDTFQAGRQSSVQGGAQYDARRDAVSFGMLIDGSGDDMFSSAPAKQGVWVHGSVGGGADASGEYVSLHPGPYKKNALDSIEMVPVPDAGLQKYAESAQVLEALEQPLFLKDSWNRAAASLAEKGPEILPPLCSYVSIKDVSVRRAVEETVRKIAESHLENIHEYVLKKEIRASHKRFLLFVLGEVGSRESYDVFMQYISSEHAALQAMSLRGLSILKEAPPAEMLSRLAEHENSAVRRYLARTLAYSQAADVLRVCAGLLADDDFDVRHAAFHSIKKHARQALPVLNALREDPACTGLSRLLVDDLIRSVYHSGDEQ